MPRVTPLEEGGGVLGFKLTIPQTSKESSSVGCVNKKNAFCKSPIKCKASHEGF